MKTSECKNNTFGYGCDTCSANCLTQPCNKFTENGVCLNGECKPGFISGGNCTTGQLIYLLYLPLWYSSWLFIINSYFRGLPRNKT